MLGDTVITVTLLDISTDEPLKFDITTNERGIEIHPHGYGEFGCENTMAGPIYIEVFGGHPKVILWSDITQENPTHIIPLDKAAESLRID